MNCGFEGCTRKKIYKTYCSGHNKQFNKGQPLRPLLDRSPVRKDANGKECRGCATYKPYEEFHNSSRAKDGKQVNCKNCQKAQKKQQLIARKFKAVHLDYVERAKAARAEG